MSEYTLQLIASLKIVWVAVGSFWYGLGGISNKWIRRFILPLWMGAGLWIFGSWQVSWQWLYLLYPLLLCASLHLGYGGDNVFDKLKRRGIYGLALGISAVPLAIINGSWVMFGWHVGVCVLASVFWGVLNPTNARSEESIIGFLSTLTPMFIV